MSQLLGYDFTRAQVDRDIYSPKAHGDVVTEQTMIRRGIVAFVNGEINLADGSERISSDGTNSRSAGRDFEASRGSGPA